MKMNFHPYDKNRCKDIQLVCDDINKHPGGGGGGYLT